MVEAQLCSLAIYQEVSSSISSVSKTSDTPFSNVLNAYVSQMLMQTISVSQMHIQTIGNFGNMHIMILEVLCGV